MTKRKKSNLPVIGWREWVGLPDFGIKAIKVKVDTGARSSSLHAFDMQEFERDGVNGCDFKFILFNGKATRQSRSRGEVLEFRSVRSSSGKAAIRPVIITNVELLGITWPVELTLAQS